MSPVMGCVEGRTGLGAPGREGAKGVRHILTHRKKRSAAIREVKELWKVLLQRKVSLRE